jgi:hypothetical protein
MRKKVDENLQEPGSTYRGNGFLTATGNNPTYASAFQNSSAVMAGLQACDTQFEASAITIDSKGLNWAIGSTGFSMFNTVQVPNDAAFPFGVCRFGDPQRLTGQQHLHRRAERPPGRHQRAVRGRHCAVREGFDHPTRLAEPGHAQRRRDHLGG